MNKDITKIISLFLGDESKEIETVVNKKEEKSKDTILTSTKEIVERVDKRLVTEDGRLLLI